MKRCQWCDVSFQSKITYQIYCSPECRAEATKEKISERYAITRRRRRFGKNRLCKSCKSPLSVYNDESICQHCVINPLDVNKALKDMKRLSNGGD